MKRVQRMPIEKKLALKEVMEKYGLSYSDAINSIGRGFYYPKSEKMEPKKLSLIEKIQYTERFARILNNQSRMELFPLFVGNTENSIEKVACTQRTLDIPTVRRALEEIEEFNLLTIVKGGRTKVVSFDETKFEKAQTIIDEFFLEFKNSSETEPGTLLFEEILRHASSKPSQICLKYINENIVIYGTDIHKNTRLNQATASIALKHLRDVSLVIATRNAPPQAHHISYENHEKNWEILCNFVNKIYEFLNS